MTLKLKHCRESFVDRKSLTRDEKVNKLVGRLFILLFTEDEGSFGGFAGRWRDEHWVHLVVDK